MNTAMLSVQPEGDLRTLQAGWTEEMNFGGRLWLGLDRYRLAHHFCALMHGEDMIKFHVRLSGQRLLTFDGHDAMALGSTATAVLLHDKDLPKTDHILAGHDEVSVTVAMKRLHFLEHLDACDMTMPTMLRDVVGGYACSPRLATAAPSRGELRVAQEMLDCSRTTPLRALCLEAKSLELVYCILNHMASPAPARTTTLRLTHKDEQRLYAVLEHLQINFVQVPRIADLVRQSGLNRNKLCTGFRSLFGVSIFDFTIELRMQEGLRLLRDVRMSVLEVALAVGYSSAASFSSAFHRHFGHPPSQARDLSS